MVASVLIESSSSHLVSVTRRRVVRWHTCNQEATHEQSIRVAGFAEWGNFSDKFPDVRSDSVGRSCNEVAEVGGRLGTLRFVMEPARHPRTDPWSIDDGYFDAMGAWRETSESTHRTIVSAMGCDPDAPAPGWPSVIVVRAGATERIAARGDLAREDGTVIALDGHLPADLPLGYHELRGDAETTRIIVVPPRCHLPDGFRIWG